ncbi:PREDICTED: uncharacterized protein LOC105367885 [Ceratosolen solmsi marchali]|uniref:Uncharacterized protein LOC105367885 n=1 Tax=Ceratosolen solmsi marchali TaxID=326594 RepID=A0AAJ6YVB5_9HYME|nr:PREDICTED: uncharacterized protein LOC105367885 [Ceratosolen solmsi marchali]
MELECSESKQNSSTTKYESSFIITSSNWEINNNKCFDDCISTVSILQAPDRISLEDIVSLDTCVALKSCSSEESCKLEFKIINQQKIARIALASEASVLEFFKQSGEYATTIFAEFIDEFQDHSVYLAEAVIEPPSTEASIKFTRRKNKGTTMWIYGIRLILTESILDSSKNMFDLDVINNLLINTNQPNYDKIEMARKVLESYASSENNSYEGDMAKHLQKIATINHKTDNFLTNHKSAENIQQNIIKKIESTQHNNDSASQDYFDLKTYIDNKFSSLEKKLTEQIELMDQNTNKKLDRISNYLELIIKSK